MFSNNYKVTSNGDNFKIKSFSVAKHFIADYQIIFQKVVDDSLAKISYLNSQDIKNRIKKMAEYFCLENKPVVGEIMLYAYEMLEDPENLSNEKTHQAYILACTLELGQTYISFIDDILDHGKIRFGKPCWHLLPDVGPLTINDVSIIRSFIYELLQQNLPDASRLKILDVFNKVYLMIATAQQMEYTWSKDTNYSNFTMENYRSLSIMKLSFAVLVLPIACAVILSNKATEDSIQQIYDVCIDLGILFQIQNDMTDYNSGRTGFSRPSTDIQEARCTWLAVKTLEICNEKQRIVFKQCYGSWDPTHTQKIRDLYEELHLPQIYIEEKQARYKNFIRKINELPTSAVPNAEVYQELISLLKKFEI